MDSKIKNKIRKAPLSPGVYMFLNSQGRFLYIGKAKVLRKRLLNYCKNPKDLDPKTAGLVDTATGIQWIKTDSEIEALLLEAEMIRRYKPKFNIDLRDDKSFVYVGINWGEDYPKVSMLRNPDFSNKKCRFFGPYTSVYSLKTAMKFLRRIFPYRTCGKIPHRKCIWYQMRNLPSPCDESINKKEYRKIISQLMKFLRGGKKDLIKKFEREMKSASKNKNYELAASLRDKIYALQHLHDASVLSDLGSSNIPQRIEGYDISNIMGKSAVGVMVVFSNGEKDTDQYRMFKIKTVNKISDTAMLAEVLKRRFKNDWPMPNLIIIDGGVGQLNIARKVILEQVKVNIPIVAIAKGPDRKGEKLFFAGRRVLNDVKLIKQVRDEAHRFAISYHKKLHRKNLLENI